MTRTVSFGLAALALTLAAVPAKRRSGNTPSVFTIWPCATWTQPPWYRRPCRGGRYDFGRQTPIRIVRCLLGSDTDHLDPDHIPVWWETDLGIDDKFWNGSREMFIGWVVGQETRMNTVSSIERQLHLLPAITGGFAGDSVQASLKGGIGYNFLEIDDDAPRLRGYDRTNLRQTTSAGALAADTTSGSERHGRSSATPRNGGTVMTGFRLNTSRVFASRPSVGPRGAR